MKYFGLPVWWWVSLVLARSAEPVPLPGAHAHNDYEHARPLAEALALGFGNVEADVWWVNGAMLVAHDLKNVNTERTLVALYLDPLRVRMQRHGGRVFSESAAFTLLIDVKSEAEATYAALDAILKTYTDLVTEFRGDRVERRAITIVISGNRAIDTMRKQAVRYAAVDGRSGDLETNPSPTLVPWVSENWQKLFSWRWEGAMPAKDRVALRAFVERAHAQGRQVRFWNTPDRREAWQVLKEAGVDLIGTDDLAGLAAFLAR
ncbi:MAG: hypothetical protein RL077_3605 [Verrucomicrobiota bacterium]